MLVPFICENSFAVICSPAEILLCVTTACLLARLCPMQPLSGRLRRIDKLLIPVVAPERTKWYVYFQGRDGFHLNLALRVGFSFNPLGNIKILLGRPFGGIFVP